MGVRYKFTCPACHYTAEVSGKGDAGMMCTTTTILCQDCKELYDVVDGWHDPKKRRAKVRCPNSKDHKFREWNHPDHCPKCGAVLEIEPGGPTVLWD